LGAGLSAKPRNCKADALDAHEATAASAGGTFPVQIRWLPITGKDAAMAPARAEWPQALGEAVTVR
jgi:hypothetical protein